MKKFFGKAALSIVLALVLTVSCAYVMPLTPVQAATAQTNVSTVLLGKGKTYQLKATGSTIKSCKSSKTSVATVTNAGKITAVASGSATITVTFTNKATAKVKVTVVSKTAANTYYVSSHTETKIVRGLQKATDTSYEYDSKGRVVKEIVSDSESVVTTETTYGSNGSKNVKVTTAIKYNKNLIVDVSVEEYTYLPDGTLATYDKYEEGALVRSEDYVNGKVVDMSDYSIKAEDVDDKGNLLAEYFYKDEDEMPSLVKNYNADGTLATETEYTVTGKDEKFTSVLVSETAYTYKKGELVSSVKTNYDKNGKVKSTVENKYDVNGEIVASKETTGSGSKAKVTGFEDTVTYDGENRRTKVVSKAYNESGKLVQTGTYNYAYNSKGQQTLDSYEAADGYSLKNEFTFDSNGVMTGKKVTENGKLIEQLTYKSGNLTKSYKFEGDDFSSSAVTMEYTYDSKNLLTKEVQSVELEFATVDAKGKAGKKEKRTSKVVTTYDPKTWIVLDGDLGYYENFLTQEVYDEGTLVSSEKFTTETDKNGNKTVTYYNGEQLVYTFKYEYDSNKNVTLSKFSDVNGNTWSDTHTYTYDSSKRMTSDASYRDGELIQTTTIKYDSNGNKTSETVKDAKGKLISENKWSYATLANLCTK